jgi:hypothetical protein
MMLCGEIVFVSAAPRRATPLREIEESARVGKFFAVVD